MRRDSRSWDGSSNKIAVVNGNVKVTSQAAQDVLSVGGKGKHTFELEGGATHFIQDFTSEKQYQARDLKIGANTVVAIERMGNGRMQESPTEVWRSGGRSFFNLVSLPPIRLNSDGSGESAALSAESIRKNQSAQTFWSFMTAGAGIGAMAGVAAIIHNNSSSRKSRGHYPVHGGYGPPSSPYPGPSQHFALSFANQFFNMFFQKTRYR
jgi:hypothetical protein